jgi:hypothetical protein
MPQVLTEGVNLAAVPESSLGATTPPTTGWFNLQPNSLGDIGPTYKKLARSPISKNRQMQRPILVDVDSAAPWESDITKNLLDNFIEGIFMASVKHSGGKSQSLYRPTAVTATGYTVAANGDYAANRLFFARGFPDAANNGLKVTVASVDAAEIKFAGLTANATVPANAELEFAGVQGAAGDIGMDADGNLTSTALDFTTLGLVVGQYIRIGDLPSGAAYAFANTVYVGTARVKAISANLLTLECRSWTVGAADAGATKTIRIFFTKYCRNVAIDHADYKTPSYAFEVTYPNLGAGPVPEYEYMLGNHIDEWMWNFPLTSKATAQMTFTGTTSTAPSVTRKDGPATAINPVTNLAVGTSTDLMRLRIANADETGVTTDFANIKVTMKNNVEPEKQLGQLGSTLMNVGKFEVAVEADCIFTSDDVIEAVHDNRITSLEVLMRNSDFGAMLNVASMSIDEAGRKFETNKSVQITAKASGFQDATLGHTASLSMFAYLPAS